MDLNDVSRREFLRKSGLTAAGIAAAPLVGCASGWAPGKAKPAADTNILLTGDIHFDLPGDHDMKWIEANNFTNEINIYTTATAKGFKPLMAVLKKQALAANPPVSAVIQLGDLPEGLAGSPEMAEQMTRHTLEAIDEAAIPAPWIIAQGNHELTGPGMREAWMAQAVPYLQKTLDPSIASMNYSYHVGDAHIVVLDPFTDQDGFVDFLAAEFEASSARYKFVALHEPVIPVSSLCWHPLMRTEDYEPPRQRLLEVIARHQAIVLCGHIHKYSVLRRMTPWGPIVQVMAYSVMREDNPKPPYPREAEYGPETLTHGRGWRPETLDDRMAMLAEEAKHVTDFFVSDVAGYAMLTLGCGEEDKIELRYYAELSTQPYETIDLAALLEGEKVS